VSPNPWCGADILAALAERRITVFNNVGFIGSGAVTRALARHLVAAGVPVYISNSRGPNSLSDLVAEIGEDAQAVTVPQAAAADVVILAVPFVRVPELADVVPDWSGRVVVDATNQFAEYTPVYSGYVDLGDETGSEWVARHLPGATVIKAFNAMYATYLAADPRHHDGRQVVFYAGDDETACAAFDRLVGGLGFAPVRVGGLRDGGKLMQLGGPLIPLHVVKQD
jgi:predicted dinucleotide-binding enzyme